MGITRLARTKWLAVPMAAASLALASPAPANAATVVRGSDRPAAATVVVETSLGSFVGDPRGATGRDRYRSL